MRRLARLFFADAHGLPFPAPAPRLRLPGLSGAGRLVARRRRLATFLAVLALFGAGASLWAYFTAPSNGPGASAKGATLPTGSTPGTPTLSGRDATVTWSQSSPAFLGGGTLGAASGGGYTILRYADSGGGSIAPGSSCSGTQTGSADPLTCTETGLPTGRWKYTVTPTLDNWVGSEGNKSASVIVPPVTPTSVSLVNGGGVGSAYINSSNKSSLSIDVALPATSLSSDTVHLSLSDGSSTVNASASAPGGAGTVHFTGIDASSLADGSITIAAKSTSSYGDDSGSTSISRTKDTVNPAVTVTPDRSPDHNGWYNHAVVFSASATDVGGSGVQSCDQNSTYSAPDGTGLTVGLHCTDKAGNVGSGTSAAFKYDSTNPTVTTVLPDRSPDSNGWYNHSVTWTASGTDGTSGIDTCESIAYTGPDGTGLTVSRSCTDNAGNTGSGTSATFKYDATAPSVTVTPGRSADSNGWYNHSVLFSASGVDPTSGIASCQSSTYSGPDGTGLTVSLNCTDNAGNTGSGTSAAFKYDATAPSVTVTPDRSADVNGWYNHAVTFTPGGTDPTSGVASCQAALVYSSPDGTGLTVQRTCTDNAGNVGTGTSATFKYDGTPPTVGSVTADRSPDSNGWYNHSVTWTANGTDATSGIASCQSLAYTGDTGGTQVSRSCTDNAGNTGGALSPTFKYDATNPSSALTFPTSSGPFNTAGWNVGCSSSICGTASDATSGVASVKVSIQQGSGNYWNGSSFGSASEVKITATSTTSWTLAFPASNFPADGSYTVRVYATDNAANTQSSATSQTFTIDKTAPVVTLTSPADGSSSTNTTPTFSGACTNGDGNVTVTVKQGVTTVQTRSTACSSGSYSVAASPALSANTYTAQASQTDAAGNTGSSSVNTFTITVASTITETALATFSSTSCDPTCSTGSVTTTSGKTELILVYWLSGQGSDSVASVSGPFTGATQVTSSIDTLANKYDMAVWKATGNGASGAVSVTVNKSINVAVIDVIQLSGNNTSSPIVQSPAGNGSGTTATASLSSPAAGDAELVMFGAGANATFTTPGGFTSIHTANAASPAFGYRSAFNSIAQASASSTVSASVPWGSIALEIAHA